MKKHFFLAAILTMVFSVFLVQPVEAQSLSIERQGDNAVKVTFDAPVDSLSLVTSDWFTVGPYISHSLVTYPVSYTKIQSSTLNKPFVTVIVEGSNDQENVLAVDTVGTVSDSLETLYSGTTDFNNKKFWYYRVKYKGEAGNRPDCIVKTDLLFIRPKQ